MPGVVMRYERHFSAGMDNKFADPAIVDVGIDPRVQGSLQSAHHEKSQDISMAYHYFMPFFAGRAKKMCPCLLCLFKALLDYVPGCIRCPKGKPGSHLDRRGYAIMADSAPISFIPGDKVRRQVRDAFP